jgi:hypothetical protein
MADLTLEEVWKQRQILLDKEYEKYQKEKKKREDYKKEPGHRGMQSKTHLAVIRGMITKEPCEACGSEKSEAHHEDYSNPLLIKWLCHKCHVSLHAKMLRNGQTAYLFGYW